jgi:hypothetical protein
VLKYASEKLKAARYDAGALFNNQQAVMHFVVETAWVETAHNENPTKNDGLSSDSEDHTHPDESGNANSNSSVLRNLEEFHSSLKSKYVNISGVRIRDWLPSTETWSVSSYDVVWGRGHLYGGASITVDDTYGAPALEAVMDRFANYSSTAASSGKCSDCVTVLHRVGAGLRSGGSSKSLNSRSSPMNLPICSSRVIEGGDSDHSNDDSSDDRNGNCVASSSTEVNANMDDRLHSFHPLREQSRLWIEIDCGLFHRQRQHWPTCRDWIGQTQEALDRSVPTGHRSHYPNVPNTATADWPEQYYGTEGFARLQQLKSEWDPNDVFTHVQSIQPATADNKKNHPVAESTLLENAEQSQPSAADFHSPSSSSSSSIWSSDKQLEEQCVREYDWAAGADIRSAAAVIGSGVIAVLLSKMSVFSNIPSFFRTT